MSKQQKTLPKLQKHVIRQITNNHSGNKLAGRIYRNSSLNHINPNISMLSSIQDHQSSFLNMSNSPSNINNSQLVASISLRKFKRKFQNQCSQNMEISNGKLLINRSKLGINDSQVKDNADGKKLFKKLDKLYHQPMNKILPDDLIDFPIQNQMQNQVKTLKKASLSPLNKKKKNKFFDGNDALLPQDFIQMLRQQKNNITNQFCYLKKMNHPYDLQIIDFDKNLHKKQEDESIVYPSQYITISSRGVTYFSQDQSRFVPLEDWKRQASYFNKINKLDFFKNFKVIKNFSNWRKYIRKSAMKSTIEQLKQKLVYNDMFLSKSLLKIRQICYIMETDVSYCRLDDCQQVLDIDSYKQSHIVFLEHQFQKKITDLQENIKEVLMNNMAMSMKQFKQQNKISSSIQGKGMPLLIGDEKNLQMPYTKQATLRTQQQKFQKYIKLIDLIVTHSKVNMMTQSTTVLVKKVQQQNQNYQRQVVDSNYKNTYKGKQYLQCILTLDNKQQQLFLQPTRQDLKSLFQTIVTRSVIRICKNHKKISGDIDVLSIIYDSQEQFPKQTQSQTLKLIMNSDNREQDMLRSIMKPISIAYNYIVTFVQKYNSLAKIHYENEKKFYEISKFQAKDYQIITSYLEQWQKQKQVISQISNQHQGSIFQVNLKKFKQEVQRKTDECIRQIKSVIPKIFQQSIKQLFTCLTKARKQIQNNLPGVKNLMVFNEDLNQISNDIQNYSEKMAEINCLQILMRNITPSSSQSNYKKLEKQTRQLQSSLNKLRDQVEKAEKNYKSNQTKAQEEVKKMVPEHKQKLAVLYSKIEKDSQSKFSANQMLSLIIGQRNQLTDRIRQFQDIRSYQKFLNLQELNPMQIQNFQLFFQTYQKIWMTVNQFQAYFTEFKEKQCGQIQLSQVNFKVQQFITTSLSLKKQIKTMKQKDFPFQFSSNDLQALDSVLQQIQQIKPVIETLESLMDPSIGQKQEKQIISEIEQRNLKLKQILQMNKSLRKPQDFISASASTELFYFKTMVIKAKKSNEINHKLQSLKNFTNFSKHHQGLFKNLTQKFKQYSGNFLQQLDEKIVIANFIIQQSQSYEKQRAKIEKNTLQKLKQIILLWDKYQQHVEYFQPIYSLTDWKNTAQAKLYIAATEQNWKKTYKNFKDYSLPKILATERIIPSLKQSNEILQSLYPSMKLYFNSKRMQCPRFCFLSDNDIVNVHFDNKDNKDFKALTNCLSTIFPTLKQLVFKQQQAIPSQVVNLDGQVLSIKISKVSNQVQEMIKILDESIKISIKNSIKRCEKGYNKSQEFNRSIWIKDNLTQVLVLVSSMFFTHIIQSDYLTEDPYDISQLLNYHESQIKILKKMIEQQKADAILHKKLFVLLTQSITFRDIIHQLKSQNITRADSYTWLKHIRTTYQKQPVQLQYLNVSIQYGNQFVCMQSNPLISVSLNEKAIVQMVNSMVGCSNVPIVCKSHLSELAVYNAKSYNHVCLSSGMQTDIVKNLIQGAWLTDSFTDFELAKYINHQQLKLIAQVFHEVQLAISLKQPHLYGFKNISLHRESGMCIISKDLINCPQLLKNCNFDYRIMPLQQVPWSLYLSLLFNIQASALDNCAIKISKIFEFLQNCITNFTVSRKQVRQMIQNLAMEDNLTEQILARMILKRLNKIYRSQSERKILAKVFNQAFNITVFQKLQSYKSISIKQCQSIEQQTQKISPVLKQNKICIITGHYSEFKQHFTINLYKNFSFSQPKFIAVDKRHLSHMLGYYENGKWINGILAINNIFSESHDGSRDCALIAGRCNKYIVSLLEKLNNGDQNQNFVNLENGQKICIQQNKKIIFIAENNVKEQIFKNCSVPIFDFDSIKLVPQQVFSYLTQIKRDPVSNKTLKQRFFKQNQTNFTKLQNIFINNFDRIANSISKLIGYKSQFNQPCLIINRFVTILNAVLEQDKQRTCTSNNKMMQKLYVWCFYWSISSSVPKRSIQRIDKLFQSFKIDYDRSQSLSQSKFIVSQRNQTITKFIKSHKIYENQQDCYLIPAQLEAKKQIIKNLVSKNNHLFLIGDRNSGKSTYIQYLSQVLQSQGYNVAHTKLTIKTTIKQFMVWLKSKTCVQYKPKNLNEKYRLCSTNGKKMVIIIDNVNLVQSNSSFFQFLETASSHDYFYDEQFHNKVFLDNICFILAKNSCYQPIQNAHSFMLRNFFPIYINQVQLTQILSLYIPLIQKIQQKPKSQLLKKLLPSIISLHQFCVNEKLQNQKQKIIQPSLSYNIPIWITKQLITYAFKQSTSSNQILSLWRYLSSNKYMLFQISNQLNNLMSLIITSTYEAVPPLVKQHEIVHNLNASIPQLQLSIDYTQYYTYLLWLLKSQQTNSLISYQCVTPTSVKSRAIEYLCKISQTNYAHIKTRQELQKLKKQQNILLYVDSSDINVVQAAIACIIQGNQARFVIDLDSVQQIRYFIRFYPDVQTKTHIYSRAPNIIVKSIKAPNYQILSKIIQNEECAIGSKMYQQQLCLINQKVLTTQARINKIIQIRVNQLQAAVANYLNLQKVIQQFEIKNQAQKNEIELLTQNQKNLQKTKLQLAQTLSSIKKKGQTEPQQSIIALKLSEVDTQLKNIKYSKISKCQSNSKLIQNIADKIQANKHLQAVKERVFKDLQLCKKISSTSKIILFKICYAILNMWQQVQDVQKQQEYKRLVSKTLNIFQEQNGVSAWEVFSALTTVEVRDGWKQFHLVQWVLFNYEIVLVTEQVDSVVEQLQLSNPQAKVCLTQYQFNQYLQQKPLITKQQSLGAGPRVTLVSSKLPSKCKLAHRVIRTQKNKISQLKSKIKLYVINMLEIKEKYEVDMANMELKRFQLERQSLKRKLKLKANVDKSQFLSVNNISEIKQIFDGITAIQLRIRDSKSKINELQKWIQQKTENLIKILLNYCQYLITISNTYSYVIINQNLILELILTSLTLKQPEIQQQQQQKQQKPQPIIKQIDIQKTTKTVMYKISKLISLMLTPSDYAYGIMLLACYELYIKQQIIKNSLDIVVSIINQNKSSKNQQLIEIKQHEYLNKVIFAILQNKEYKMCMMLQFASQILKIDAKILLKQKQYWMPGLTQIFTQSIVLPNNNTITSPPQYTNSKKIFIAIGSQHFNSYKILDNSIRKYINNQQSIFYLQQQLDIDHRLQLLEKTPQAQQAFIVLKNWTHRENIAKIIQYCYGNKQYKLVIYFDTFANVPKQLPIVAKGVNYLQVCLDDASSRNLCNRAMRLFQAYNVQRYGEKKFGPLGKCLKYIFADQLSKLCKSIVDPANKFTNFNYKNFEDMVQKAQEMPPSGFISFAIDYIYTAANKISSVDECQKIVIHDKFVGDQHVLNKSRSFLRQCKRMLSVKEKKKTDQVQNSGKQVKQNDNLEYKQSNQKVDIIAYEYQGMCQLYSLFCQSCQDLVSKLSDEQSFKKFVDCFLPKQIRSVITTDSILFGSSQTQNKSKGNFIKSELTSQLNKQQAKIRIQSILQKNQAISKCDQNEKTTNCLITQILKQQKKNMEQVYQSKLQKCKKLMQILESNVKLSTQTCHAIASFITNDSSNTKQSITNKLGQIYTKIQALQKQIQNKQQINLGLCLLLVTKPKQLLYTYLIQQNAIKLDWNSSHIFIKCLTQKQKQTSAKQANKYIPLTNVKIINGKLNLHKCCVLQQIQQGEISKQVSAVICISKQQPQGCNRFVPLVVNGQNIAYICMNCQVKESGFWSANVTALIAEENGVGNSQASK